jgi:hypothetical protein
VYFHLYLRNGTVYLPTTGKMDKGFYRDVEPVEVVLSSNTEALRQALAAMIARGNPGVPMLQRREWPLPVVPRHAGLKNWSAFERGLSVWSLEQREKIFSIIRKKKKSDGARVDDPERTVVLPPGTAVDAAIDRMIAILQEAAKEAG